MTAQFPKISLVICTYNRDRYILQALESIDAQTADKTLFELVVIDNNSTDNTASIVKKFISEHPGLDAHYFFETNKGLSFARNRGITEARSPILCYIDDDVILSTGYVQEMISFFESHPHATGVGGKVIPKYESGTEPAWMNKYLNGFVGRVDHGTEIKKYDQSMKYPAGCNMTYTKDILHKAGGFNNDLTFRSDDKYMFYKVSEISDEIYYLPSAYLQHYIDSHRLTFDNFRKLFLKTGNEEKIRIRKESGASGLIKKFVDLGVKLGASIVLYLLFILKGQGIKGRYLLYAQWFTFKGFLSKSVFVR